MAEMKLIAGNWKMFGSPSWEERLQAVIAGAGEAKAELLICPPFPLIGAFAARAKDSRLMIGAQNCHQEAEGAFTGEVSAALLAEVGASHVILGHSERRALFHETNALVKAKAEAVIAGAMVPIVCVGETIAERGAGKAAEVVVTQLTESAPESCEIVVAYEPVWAIGTGLVPSIDDIAAMHQALRTALVSIYAEPGRRIRILYGGSVKPSNAAEILPINEVGGALVGGASLKAQDFLAIAGAA